MHDGQEQRAANQDSVTTKTLHVHQDGPSLHLRRNSGQHRATPAEMALSLVEARSLLAYIGASSDGLALNTVQSGQTLANMWPQVESESP